MYPEAILVTKCQNIGLKKGHQKRSEMVFIFSPAFYLIMWVMTSPKNFEKNTL